jgi:hypothetical protein
MTIVANPSRVCLEHGLEFWTGLLAYTRGRLEPCVKHERRCVCRECEGMETARVRALAILSAGPSPGDHVDFQIPLAS